MGAVSWQMGTPASEIAYLCSLSLLACFLVLVQMEAQFRFREIHLRFGAVEVQEMGFALAH